MTDISPIERVVMRRVHIIRVLRVIFSNAVLAAVAATAALWGIGREVWVAKVFANGPHDLVGQTRYLFYAFQHTHLAVQILSLITLAAFITLARETARFISATIQSLTYAPN
ncbi:MAG: hypothetical protein ACYC48_00790 [Minisyncoccota bacterium]